MRIIDLSGMTFGKLHVLRQDSHSLRGNAKWVCRCECGTEKSIVGAYMRSGRVISCGCHRKQLLASSRTKHGMTNSPTWSVWREMRKRCSNPKADSYKHYGGRGITVCQRWADFSTFLADMGERPENGSIERVNVNGNYEPGNCVWIPAPEQHNNPRRTIFVSLNGESVCLKEACKCLGLRYSRVYERIQRLGWSFEKAISEPKKINETIYA